MREGGVGVEVTRDCRWNFCGRDLVLAPRLCGQRELCDSLAASLRASR